MIEASSISVGRRVTYKGDMANSPGSGAVISINVKSVAASGSMHAIDFSRGRLVPIDDSRTFNIALDDGRIFRNVFVSSIGGEFLDKSCRFMLDDGCISVDDLAALEAAHAIRQASLKAKADEVAAEMVRAKAAALKAGLALGLMPEADFNAAKKRGSAAAHNLRIELKAAGIKASVKQDGYSAINVRIESGSRPAAKAICAKYKAGSFDGMTDCYDYDPCAWGLVFGDVRYVFCQGGEA